MDDAAMFQASMNDPDIRLARLDLIFSKDISAMPGSEGAGFESDTAPNLLVVDTSGCFDVVSFIYQSSVGDLEGVRHFTNGDVPRPESEFIAWALLPDLT